MTTGIRLMKKVAALAFLTGVLIASRGSEVRACVDLISCWNGCDFQNVFCSQNCDSIPQDEYAACEASCDSQYSRCFDNCVNNACS